MLPRMKAFFKQEMGLSLCRHLRQVGYAKNLAAFAKLAELFRYPLRRSSGYTGIHFVKYQRCNFISF